MNLNYILSFLLICALFACQHAPPVVQQVDTKQHLPPDERFGQLFVDVQMTKVFPDGKTFVDCTPLKTTDEILQAYNEEKDKTGFELKAFVLEHFELPKNYASGFQSDTSKTTENHINSLWPVLTRQPEAGNLGSIIALPHPYIVPGGRFGEIYYWDSYFTMLGLQVAGKTEMIEHMVNNFAFLIDSVGFIPNGNRTYFLSRSQPPFFAQMVKLLAEEKGDDIVQRYLPQLEKEYAFWMEGLTQLNASNPTHKHLVRLKDGSILNRYWDKGTSPRAEMHRDDVETAEKIDRPDEALFRDLRSACESGWDFSSRWFRNPDQLETIHTTEIIPVDLNALLYDLELTIAKGHELNKNQEKAALFQQRASQRKTALLEYCWDSDLNYFADYDFVAGQCTDVPSIAGMFPLYFNMAEKEQADKSADFIKENFLQPGGVPSTLNITGQQWDAPNGWAPIAMDYNTRTSQL
jgi:alpha,alpha-trehalase